MLSSLVCPSGNCTARKFSCAGEAQGPTRYARGLDYVAMLKARDGDRLRHRVLTVDGVGHDERRMFMSACGLAVLFDRPGCPRPSPQRPPG